MLKVWTKFTPRQFGDRRPAGEISGRHSAELPHLHFSSQHRRTLKGRKSLLWVPFLGLNSVKLDNSDETSLWTGYNPSKRHRQWKRAGQSLTPCKVEEAPNSPLTDLWSHFELLNFEDVIIIRLHILKDLLIVPYLKAPFLWLQFFPRFLCIHTIEQLCTSFFCQSAKCNYNTRSDDVRGHTCLYLQL